MGVFWAIQALIYLDYEFDHTSVIASLDRDGVTIQLGPHPVWKDSAFEGNTIYWDSQVSNWNDMYGPEELGPDGVIPSWNHFDPLVILAHEIGHASDSSQYPLDYWERKLPMELYAVEWENKFRYMFYKKVPGYHEGGYYQMYARPVYGWSTVDDFQDAFTKDGIPYPHDESAMHPDITWGEYFGGHYEHIPVVP